MHYADISTSFGGTTWTRNRYAPLLCKLSSISTATRSYLSDEFDAAEDAEVDDDPGDARAERELPDDGALVLDRVSNLQHEVAETTADSQGEECCTRRIWGKMRGGTLLRSRRVGDGVRGSAAHLHDYVCLTLLVVNVDVWLLLMSFMRENTWYVHTYTECAAFQSITPVYKVGSHVVFFIKRNTFVFEIIDISIYPTWLDIKVLSWTTTRSKFTAVTRKRNCMMIDQWWNPSSFIRQIIQDVSQPIYNTFIITTRYLAMIINVFLPA